MIQPPPCTAAGSNSEPPKAGAGREVPERGLRKPSTEPWALPHPGQDEKPPSLTLAAPCPQILILQPLLQSSEASIPRSGGRGYSDFSHSTATTGLGLGT